MVTTRAGTPEVAAESEDSIVGQWEECRKRPTTDLVGQSVMNTLLVRCVYIPRDGCCSRSLILFSEHSKKNDRQGRGDEKLN